MCGNAALIYNYIHKRCEDLIILQLASLDSEGRAVLTEHIVTGWSDSNSCEPTGANEGSSGSSEGPAGGANERRLVVLNVYCPMYDPARDKDGEGVARLDYKMNFYRLLEERCSALERAGK